MKHERGYDFRPERRGCDRTWRPDESVAALPSRPRSPLAIASGILLCLGLGLGLGFAGSASAEDYADMRGVFAHYGCNLCHEERETLAGPSWAEIAAGYRGNPRAAAAIVKVVRQGRHGNGIWPMPPLPEVGEEDAKRIARYVLALEP